MPEADYYAFVNVEPCGESSTDLKNVSAVVVFDKLNDTFLILQSSSLDCSIQSEKDFTNAPYDEWFCIEEVGGTICQVRIIAEASFAEAVARYPQFAEYTENNQDIQGYLPPTVFNHSTFWFNRQN